MDKVNLARDARRPKIQDYIDNLFTDFFEQKGDMLGKEDGSIMGGIALFHGTPVTIVGHKKGNNLEENLTCNFGMPGPEGYRKAIRLMEQAEKYNHEVKREYAFLIAHSMLHLFGYDHMDEVERENMEIRQDEILNRLGITR